MGITLVELLVVILIIGTLAALSFPLIQKLRNSADIVSGQSAMKNIGTALAIYLVDKDGKLPRVFYSQQFVVKEKHMAGRDLFHHLAPYLGAETLDPLDYVPGTASNAFLRKYKPANTPAYFANPSVVAVDGSYMAPFGYRENQDSKKIILIPSPSQQVALIDLDALLPSPNGTPIGGAGIPDAPIYKDRRIAIYFDWHSQVIPQNTNFYFDKLW